jgi:hypothetical protein
MFSLKECCGINPDYPSRCMVANCEEPIIAEVHCSSYAEAWKLFSPATANSRKPDRRIYICEKHLREDRRARRVKWQGLLFPV